jgi:nucleoside-diphosphate-sugar epimerase
VPLQVDPESYLNLIHVNDLASYIRLVSEVLTKERLYCVSDGAPVARKEYYEYIAKLGDWPTPVFDLLDLHSRVKIPSRSDGNKRVRNDRIQSELKLRFQFPSYREGVKSLMPEFGSKLEA